MASAAPSPAALRVQGGAQLAHYLSSGKKKNDRWYWLTPSGAQGRVSVSWAKKNKGSGKEETLLAVHAEPKIPTARELFEEMDADHSGSLDQEEVAALYKKARGEKLSKKDQKKAMKEMDSDDSGGVDVQEFEAWWATNGGDLEKHRDRAFTLVCKGGIELLLVAPTEQAKQVWVDGCSELLGSATPKAEEEPIAEEEEQAPQPESRWVEMTCGERAYYFGMDTNVHTLKTPAEGIHMHQESESAVFDQGFEMASKMDSGEVKFNLRAQPEPEPEPRAQPEPEPEPQEEEEDEDGQAAADSNAEPLPQQEEDDDDDEDGDLRNLYARLDRNHDGIITRAELIKSARADADVRSALGLPQEIRDGQRAQFESIFQGMDVDDSKGISFGEFAAFVRSKSGEGPPPSLELVVVEKDLPAGIDRSIPAIGAAWTEFHRLDRDESFILDHEQIKTVLTSLGIEMSDRAMGRAYAEMCSMTADGKKEGVSFDAFADWCVPPAPLPPLGPFQSNPFSPSSNNTQVDSVHLFGQQAATARAGPDRPRQPPEHAQQARRGWLRARVRAQLPALGRAPPPQPGRPRLQRRLRAGGPALGRRRDLRRGVGVSRLPLLALRPVRARGGAAGHAQPLVAESQDDRADSRRVGQARTRHHFEAGRRE